MRWSFSTFLHIILSECQTDELHESVCGVAYASVFVHMKPKYLAERHYWSKVAGLCPSFHTNSCFCFHFQWKYSAAIMNHILCKVMTHPIHCTTGDEFLAYLFTSERFQKDLSPQAKIYSYSSRFPEGYHNVLGWYWTSLHDSCITVQFWTGRVHHNLVYTSWHEAKHCKTIPVAINKQNMAKPHLRIMVAEFV